MQVSLNASLHGWCCFPPSFHMHLLYMGTKSHTHTCKHTCRVWAMQYNKQRGSNVVSFAPCAIVEKPHEGLWVLKDKPWLAGRESVMQQENCVFHPFFPPSFISSQSLFSLPLIPSSVFHQILSLTLPTFFFLPPSFLSFCGILDSVVILSSLKCLDHWNVPSKRWADPRGRDRPAQPIKEEIEVRRTASKWCNNNLLKSNYNAIAIDTSNDRMYMPMWFPNYGLCIMGDC